MTRKSVQDMKARDIMSRKLITVEPDEDVSSALGKMQHNDINEVPVIDDNGEIVGLVNYETMLKRRSIPMSAKVENVMAFPPRVCEDASVMDIAETMLSSGYRAVPVTEKHHVVGIVSRTDLVNIIPGLKILSNIEVNEIMTGSPHSVSEKDSVDQARAIMYKLDVRALPVIDSNEEIVGVVGLKDLAKVTHRERNRQTTGDVKGGKIAPTKMAVRGVMNSPPITINEDQKIVDVVELMNSNNISSIIVTKKNKPVGIVTQFDLIELIASFKHEDQVFVQISGLHEADPDAYDMMYELIQKHIKRVSKIVTPKIFTIHVAAHEAGSDHISGDVTVRGRMTTEHELYYSSAEDWDLMKALSTMLSIIEKSVRKDKEKKVAAQKKR